MNTSRWHTAICLCGFLACTPYGLQADWNQGEPAKWVQMPDLSTLGMDVRDWKHDTTPGQSRTLADDWQCRVTGLITNIHIWGSWTNDQVYPNPSFVLAIHADIPANPPSIPYSRPGAVLWSRRFDPGSYQMRQWGGAISEGWCDPAPSPNGKYQFPGDHACFQYNFPIMSSPYFQQTGTVDRAIVYWLEVQAVHPVGTIYQFGWKTSTNHWNDTAVWYNNNAPWGGTWNKLTYPLGHAQYGQNVDLAFVIQGEQPEPPPDSDFGDAPDSAAVPRYPTLLANNGARHKVVSGAPYFADALGGDAPDAEADGQPNANATGDDTDANGDDEDGVAIPVLQVGVAANITGFIAVGGWVDAWVDWNGDGDWADVGENVYSGAMLAGPFAIPVTAPGPFVGQTFARFRIHTGAAALPVTGAASDGEVEDHEVWIEEHQMEPLDYGDAPDGAAAPRYPTLLANNGARHFIVAGAPYFCDVLGGDAPDAEADGQPNATATGDDTDANGDDEDGVTIPVPLVIGQAANINVWLSAAGWVDAWIDWSGDGVWQEPGERIFGGSLPLGLSAIAVTPPAGSTNGQTFARFRVHTDDSVPLLPTGAAYDGEVEDHAVTIQASSPPASPYKWVQYPDGRPTYGVDVMASRMTILADDFRCTTNGAITNIVIWGSWSNNVLPSGSATNVQFTLSIHSDLPAGTGGTNWSQPGAVLWWTNFARGQYQAVSEFDVFYEGWLTPDRTNYLYPGDWTCWRYTFAIDPASAFVQTGTVQRPITYWLDAQAFNIAGTANFGWKTSTNHWNDDAVWGRGFEPYPGPWYELRYPMQHPLYGQSMDLAFAIASGPAHPEAGNEDFGDAPDGPLAPGYPTLLANNGARHTLSPGLLLGAVVDAEADGQPTGAADGDDLNPPVGPDDEDGVVFISAMYPGLLASIQVTTVGSGYLSAWLDNNADSDWDDPGEQVITDLLLLGGPTNLAFNVGPGAPPATYMRFRFSSVQGLTVRNAAPDGEVEDYRVYIEPLPSSLDFGDAPNLYPVLLAQNGARHANAGLAYAMGAALDTEADGAPSALADGDDLTGATPDDEDGVTFPVDAAGRPALVQGSNMTVVVTTPGAPWLSAWVDFNGDGDWTDPGETVAAGLPLAAGANNVAVTAPTGSYLGPTYARFRTSSMPQLLPIGGLVADGEVEDYWLQIYQPVPPSPGGASVTITNIAYETGSGARLKWQCDASLLTKPQACSNIVQAAGDPALWLDLTGPGASQQHLDGAALSTTARFYRIVAPYVYP
jgi:hypothetical protein